MRRLIQTELLKLRTIRLPYWLLVSTAGLTAMITGLLASRAGHVTQAGGHIGIGGTLPPLNTQAGVEVVITATRFGLLFATIIGIILVTAEFRHGTATSTYLATPHRNRVMLAKIVAAAGVGALFGLIAAGAATGMGTAFVAGKGFGMTVSGATMLRYAAGSALSAALFAAIGAAVGSLIRNQVAGIVGVFAWGVGVREHPRRSVPLVRALASVHGLDRDGGTAPTRGARYPSRVRPRSSPPSLSESQ